MTEASSAPRVGHGLRLASLIGVLLVALVSASRADAQTLPEPVPSLLGPPTQDGKPVRVAVGVRILNIPMIDEVAQRVDMVGYLTAEWKDPRLAYTPREEKDAERVYQPGEIWMPRFQFPDAVSPHTRYDSQLSVKPDGTVHYIERWSASLSSHFYLQRFPFDSQVLRLSIQPFLANAEREVLSGRPEMTGIDADASEALVQWRVGEIGIASRTVARGRHPSARHTITRPQILPTRSPDAFISDPNSSLASNDGAKIRPVPVPTSRPAAAAIHVV